MKELEAIVNNGDRNFFPPQYKNLLLSQIKRLPNAELKEFLFSYYSLIGDINTCNAINARSRRYLQKLNEGISKEDFMIREQLLEKENNINDQSFVNKEI